MADRNSSSRAGSRRAGASAAVMPGAGALDRRARTRLASETGLIRQSSIPAARKRASSSGMVWAVTATMRLSFDAPCARTSPVAVTPSITGIEISIKTTSKRCAPASSTPAVPSVARVTRWPRLESISSRTMRLVSLSSTTRMSSSVRAVPWSVPATGCDA
jgi:hypothetical protein